MLPSRAATAVTFTEDKQRRAINSHRFMFLDTSLQVAKIGVGCVCLGRRHMTNDLASIGTHPHECRMRKVIDIVPAQFLGQETIHVGQATELRKLARISKSVRKPERATSRAELGLKEPLAVEELSHKRLTTGQICVVLDPATTDRVELALLYLLLDSLVGSRIVGLEPLVLLSLGTSKIGLWVPLHEIALVHPRANDFALCLSPRPEPATIDVAMTNSEDDGILSYFIHLVRVNIGTENFTSNFSALEDRVLVVDLECVDYLHGYSQCMILLSRILRKLTGSVADLPDIYVKLASWYVDGHNIGFAEVEASVGIRRSNGGSTVGGVSKHTIASHFDINSVLFAIAE
ncbi:hypothetical protein HG531_011626 [Fusarium graminearum]|nr:hypothetical protein HG531_011626 [Fusarium graminearum]